jgi:hypothetical protein
VENQSVRNLILFCQNLHTHTNICDFLINYHPLEYGWWWSWFWRTPNSELKTTSQQLRDTHSFPTIESLFRKFVWQLFYHFFEKKLERAFHTWMFVLFVHTRRCTVRRVSWNFIRLSYNNMLYCHIFVYMYESVCAIVWRAGRSLPFSLYLFLLWQLFFAILFTRSTLKNGNVPPHKKLWKWNHHSRVARCLD